MEEHARDHIEGLEDAFAFRCGRLERRHLHFAIIENVLQILDRRDIRQVALVVLHHVWDVVEVEVERLQVFLQVAEGLDVLLHLVVLRIGHEDDAIDAAQHDLARRIVDHLAWHGEERELGLETLDRHRLEREEIEEKRAIGAGRQRGHLAFGLGVGHLDVGVDLLEIRRLPALRRAVVDDLHLQLPGRLIDDGHEMRVLGGRLRNELLHDEAERFPRERLPLLAEHGEINLPEAISLKMGAVRGHENILHLRELHLTGVGV